MFGIPYDSLDLVYLPQYPIKIPAGLQTLKQYLVHNSGLKFEGLFRVNGSEQVFLDAQQDLDMGCTVDELNVEFATIGQLIKAFYREYPISSPGFFNNDLLKIQDSNDQTIINEFINLNEPNRSMITWLLDLCVEIIDNINYNKMNEESLSICLCPNLIRHQDPSELLMLQRSTQILFEKLIKLRKNNLINLPASTITIEESYKPSYSNGIFGSFFYPIKDLYQGIRRSSALHSREIIYQALGIQFQPTFRLTWSTDNIDDNKIDITNEEYRLIDELKNLLEQRHNYKDIPKSDLIRYVIGCKHRIPICERRFLNMKQMERDNHLNDVSLAAVRDELSKPCYLLCGKDYNGRAIIGFRISEFNPDNTDISIMMKSIITLVDAYTSDLDVLRNGVVLLMDMNGLNMNNFSPELEKVFIKSFQDAYPLKMKLFIIVNAPFLIRVALQIAKPFLSKKLKKRIVIVKSESNLWKLVDKTQVPSCCDGTFDLNNDGRFPITAWQFVCSKVIGDLPPMNILKPEKIPSSKELHFINNNSNNSNNNDQNKVFSHHPSSSSSSSSSSSNNNNNNNNNVTSLLLSNTQKKDDYDEIEELLITKND